MIRSRQYDRVIAVAALFVIVLRSRTCHCWQSRTDDTSMSLPIPSDAFSVIPPRTNQDWTDLSKLLVAVFDEEDNIGNRNERRKLGKKLWWNMFEKPALEEYVYKQYVRTARSMKRRKYSILLAKNITSGAVVGMAELGLDAKRPTVGVLCVASETRHQGVGRKLLESCESVVCSTAWNQTVCYVEVEDSNKAAVDFFSRQGYVTRDDADTRMVRVRQGRRLELRPHRILSKQLHPRDDG